MCLSKLAHSLSFSPQQKKDLKSRIDFVSDLTLSDTYILIQTVKTVCGLYQNVSAG